MIKKGAIVTIVFIISTFIQLISQIVVTRIFGAKLNLDIFLAAVAIPTIIVTVIYGTLNDAFLPLYGEHRAKDKNHESYFVSMVLTLGLLSLLIAWIMGFLSEPISALLYANRGITFVKDVAQQMSFMFYSIPAAVIATLFGSYFYLHKQFVKFPVAQAAGSIVNLGIILLLATHIGTWAMVIAFVVNLVAQIFFVIPPIKLSKVFDTNAFKFSHIVTLSIAWIPLIIGSFAARSDTLIIRSFGSYLPAGYLVYLNLIAKLFNLAAGMMTIGIQIIQLPHLVEYFNAKKFGKAIEIVNKSKIVAIAVSIVTTISVAIVAPILIYILFVGGKFTKHDSVVAASLLPYFILPALGWGINSVFMQPLIALKKQLHVGVLNVVALIFGWSASSMILKPFGPLVSISAGLIILLFTGIIGSELLWQYYRKKLIKMYR